MGCSGDTGQWPSAQRLGMREKVAVIKLAVNVRYIERESGVWTPSCA